MSESRPLVLAPHEVRAALRGPVLIVRAVRPQPPPWLAAHLDSGFRTMREVGLGIWAAATEAGGVAACRSEDTVSCPLGSPGDRLWIREAWGYRCSVWNMLEPLQQHHVQYRADGAERAIDRPKHDRSGLPRQRPEREGESEGRYREYLTAYWAAWRSPVTMPRWASRLTVEVESVEVRRASTITEEEAQATGYEARLPFAVLWDSRALAGARWDDNPWCWFVRVKVRAALGEQLDRAATTGGRR